MKDSAHTLIFAAVLGLLCSLALATVSRFTGPRRAANEEAEKKLNFLAALEVPLPERTDAQRLLEIFEENVQVRDRSGVEVYAYVPPASGGEALAAAVPFSGPGLWGPIYGVLALEPDMVTIRDVRFYKHEETPGLGGEISADWFRKQFAGKRIISRSGEPGVRILKPGSEAVENGVDGITGATMTCRRVEEMLAALGSRLKED